jgi:hypothetical protein
MPEALRERFAPEDTVAGCFDRLSTGLASPLNQGGPGLQSRTPLLGFLCSQSVNEFTANGFMFHQEEPERAGRGFPRNIQTMNFFSLLVQLDDLLSHVVHV